LLAVALDRPAALGLLLAACAAPLVFLGLSHRWLLRGLGVAALTVWTTMLSQGLFYADQPRVAVLAVGPLRLYREGLVHGAVQSMRFVALSLAGLALALSTPPDRLFAALLRLRIPFGLGFLAVTALRFVPVVGREAWIVRRARASRGRAAWRRAPWAWLALEVSLLRPVVARSLRRARALAEALDARGFDALAPRAVRRPLVMRGWEAALLAGALGLALLALALRGLYAAYTAEIIWFPELREVYGFVRRWM
jgi:energy-coupling factor transport system permease protein